MPKPSPAVAYNARYGTPLSETERDALIEAHLPQVKFIVERIAARLPHTVDREDLISAGVLGLLDATAKYDPSRGVQFKTYAELRVRGAILDSLRSLDSAPRSMRQRAREVEAAYKEIERQHGRAATEEEVAERMGIPLAQLQTTLGELSWLTVARLDDEDDEGQPGLAHQIADDPTLTPSALFERTEQREQLVAAIDRLRPREREVIALYYVDELTMKEIGAVLGITESRVCQIHTQAVLHLRTVLAPHAGGLVRPRKK
jgi:RNA polymerase sigma factor for flagellar operon FliA